MSVDGRMGGRADTELKTKTPHVNVGNKGKRERAVPGHGARAANVTL